MNKSRINSIVRYPSFVCLIAYLAIFSPLSADETAFSELTQQVSELEDILLKPEKNQIAVLLSIDSNSDFILDSVNLYIDNKKTQTYLYSERESQALLNSAIQKIYVANISEGNHTIKAQFSALGDKTQTYNISSSSKFTKTSTTKYVELNISKSVQQDLPVLNIKFWE